MTQRYDNHPYMSKSQLDEYLASLRKAQPVMQSRHSRESSYGDPDEQRNTPLVRALKERYGSGNTTVPYVDVSSPKGRESPTKRSLPPLPGAKSENAFSWRRHQKSPSKESQYDDYRQNDYAEPERSPSPPKRNDFWSTGIPPTIITSPTRGQRPLPPDPRDDLRMPAIDEISLEENKPAPPTDVPVLNTPSDTVPSLNIPSINVPDEPAESTASSKVERALPNIYVRSKFSPTLLCDVCDRPIAGRIVTAVGHRFHPECFRCDVCQTELEHVAFYENDGRVYCHLDYHELFSPRCKHCSTPIENEVISALGNKYHPGHFFCAGCGDPFGATTPFIVRDKYPWCERCYENKYAPKCAKCRKPVLDEVLNAMGKTWHPSGCFVCKECGQDFGDNGFFIDSADNKPICKTCKHLRLVEQVNKVKA